MDYLSAVWFFLLALSGVACMVPNRMSKQPGWASLGCAFLLCALLRLWPLLWCGEKTGEAFGAIPLSLLIGSVIFALLSARQFSGNRIPLFVVVLPLLIWALLSWIMEPWTILNRARWFIWAPSLFVLTCTLFIQSTKKIGEWQVGGRLLAFGIALLAISNPEPPVYDAIVKAIGPENNVIAIHTALLRAFFTTIACSAIAIGTWICFSKRSIAEKEIEDKVRRRGMILGALLIAVLIGGSFWTKYTSIASDQAWRDQLRQEAQVIAAAIDPKLVAQLSGSPDDVKLPTYAVLKERLHQIVKASGSYHFAYLLAMKDKQIIFLVDDEPSNSKDLSLPGDVMRDAESELYAGFEQPKPFVTGPNADQWGTWITAYAPIRGITVDGHPIYLGVDDNAAQWNEHFDRLRQEKMLTVLVVALFVTGLIFINYLTSEARIRQAASEERLRLSLQGANLVSWELDVHAQTLLFNQRGEKNISWMGLPRQLTAQEFLTLLHPDDWKIARKELTSFFQGGLESIESEFRLRQEDGSYRWVIIRGQIMRREGDGERLRASGLLLDISERKMTELELISQRQESTRLALVAENTTSAVVITNADGEIEWVNQGFTKVTGYSLDESKGKTPGSFLQGKETDPKAVERIRKALSLKMGFEETILNYHKNGTPYWTAIECQPLLNEKGEASGFMAIQADVTSRVKAEMALKEQRTRLQQINISLLMLGDDFKQNIKELCDLAAQVFGAERVFYGKRIGDCFVIVGGHGLTDDDLRQLPLEPNLYCQVIQEEAHFVALQRSSLNESQQADLGEFETYIGEGIHLHGGVVGSLNILFKSPCEMTEDLFECLRIISQAIGKEELLYFNRCRIESLANLEITERSRFATLLKNIDDAVLVENELGEITYANPAFELMFHVAFPLIEGISCDAMLTRSAPLFLQEEEFLSGSQKVIAAGKASLDEVYQTKEGRYLAQDLFPILNQGVAHGFLWRYRDITRFRKHQLLLEAIGDVGQLLLNTSFKTANTWLALVTMLGKKIGIDRVRVSRYRFASDGSFLESQVFVEWDQKAAQSFYHDTQEIVRYSNSSAEQPANWLEQYLNGLRVYERGTEITSPLLKRLGTISFLGIPIIVAGELWGTMGFHYSSSPYAWEENEITLLETLTSLISARLDLQESEKELIAAKNAAIEASRAKSTFLATMSHEIRTPLNAVIGVSSLLLETKLEPQQRDYASTVAASGETLLELINDILDYSKIEAGKIEIEQNPFPLSDALIETLEVLAWPSAEKKLELTYWIDPALPAVVLGDRTRVKQVLLNLVSNAVKFTPSGTIELRAEATGQELLCFKVSDTGIGIDQEAQKRLFLPFMQADSSVTRKYGGTGLGLAISKRLVELMGGTISVMSKQGEGTTFSFEIPLLAGEEDPRARPAPDLALVGKKVLVVDDTEANRNFLRNQLHLWGMITVDAVGAKEALALLQMPNEFALVLLDYQMPDLDGISLAQAIKKLSHAKHLPLILLSSVIERVPPEHEKLFSSALTKPLRASQLLEVISSAMGKIPAPEASSAEASKSAPIRVLVAEDNLTNQKVISMMLSRMGVTPVIVENGVQAVAAVEKADFDLALIDIQMPVMDGLQAAKLMREYFGEKQRPRIIALTANAFKEDREACLAAGMDDYLVKPITLDRLRAVVEKIAMEKSSVS